LLNKVIRLGILVQCCAARTFRQQQRRRRSVSAVA